MSYKLFSDELTEACWDATNDATMDKVDYKRVIKGVCTTLHEFLMSKGLSQLEIDDMRFAPMYPNGIGPSWVAMSKEQYNYYRIDEWDGYDIWVKKDSAMNALVKLITTDDTSDLSAKEYDALMDAMWVANARGGKDVFIYSECSSCWSSDKNEEFGLDTCVNRIGEDDEEHSSDSESEEESEGVDIDVLKAQMKELQNSVAKMAKLLAKLGV
jgi:hypothetical protein